MLRQELQADLDAKPESREIELKFLATESGFKAIQQWPALAAASSRNAQRLVTRYFDTEQGDLARRRMALRMRKQGRRHVMTLKFQGDFAGGMFERGEIEAVSPGPEPELSLLGPECAALLTGMIGDRPLIPIFETDIRRTLRRITSDVCDIEVAFDAGFIRAADRKSPIREIELELKSGDPAELYRLGILLAEGYPVRLGMLAKAERGALLRADAQPRIVRAASPLTGSPTVDEAIGSLINACIAQFIGNFPAFEAGDAVTAVHQMRVAMRRLRAILKLFNRAFPCAEFKMFSAQARRIATILGGGRNWDVFLDLLREGPAAAFPDEAGFGAILAAAEQHRDAGYAAIVELLASPATTCFVLSIQAFIVRRGWRNALAAESLSRLSAPALDFADAHLHRMVGKLRKRGKHLQSLGAHQRHELRIGLKNLRYTAELFAGLFGHAKERRDFLGHTAKLQDLLGSYNDLVTAFDRLDELKATLPAASYATGIIAGWCRHGAIPNDAALLWSWKKFQKAKLFSA